jgi:hypothetical protein
MRTNLMMSSPLRVPSPPLVNANRPPPARTARNKVRGISTPPSLALRKIDKGGGTPRSYNHTTPLPTPLLLPLLPAQAQGLLLLKRGARGAAEDRSKLSSLRTRVGCTRSGAVRSSLRSIRARNGTSPRRTIRRHHRISTPHI